MRSLSQSFWYSAWHSLHVQSTQPGIIINFLGAELEPTEPGTWMSGELHSATFQGRQVWLQEAFHVQENPKDITRLMFLNREGFQTSCKV